MRIISLLPSITEIICSLGMESFLVGRSHECDFPPSVQKLPSCTEVKFEPDGISYQINEQVKALVQEGLSVYRVNADKLVSLKPDLILTQDHCEACAVSYAEVQKSVTEYFDYPVQILSVSPNTVDEVLLSIREIAESLKVEEKGDLLIKNIIQRLNNVRSTTVTLPTPKVICLEWIEPLMSAGNWFPELVEIAGGKSVLGKTGEPSPWIEWEKIANLNPDILLISPCGYSIKNTADEITILTEKQGWDQLEAVKNERVYIMEGDHYFHRPGPRLADSAEILAEIFYPGIFEPRYRNTGWVRLSEI